MLPVVLLAGMNCTADLWADTGLDGDELTVICPTLDSTTLDDQVAALRKALPESFVLVGHSLGGIVAMALALDIPHRVAGLCLVSTNAKAPTSAQREGWRKWIARLDDGTSARELQASILDSLIGAESARTGNDLVERVLRMGDETGEQRLRAQLEMQLTRADLLARIDELPTPALVVSGLDDAVCPPHFHTEIVAQLADARLVSLDAGHLLPMTRASEFGALVRSWSTQIARRRRAPKAATPN